MVKFSEKCKVIFLKRMKMTFGNSISIFWRKAGEFRAGRIENRAIAEKHGLTIEELISILSE